MKILVTGGNTVNKGAHLMLIAFASQILERFPQATLLVSPTVNLDAHLRELGFKTLRDPIFLFTSSSKLFNLSVKFPRVARVVLKYVYKKTYAKGDYSLLDMDFIFDISGFSFGDKWGVTALKNLETLASVCQKHSIPLILMPQALGPFTGNIKEAARAAFRRIPLVFARDSQSFLELKQIKTTGSVDLKPDITLNMHVESTFDNISVPVKGKYCCVVPNVRMLDKADGGWPEKYLEFLNKGINIILSQSNLSVIVLAHCNMDSGDYKLSQKIVDGFEGEDRVQLAHNDSPIQLKKILGGAEFLVGSRFHALASALSSNVPSVGTSWNHKYEQLFKDFSCEEYSHKIADDDFLKSIEVMLSKDNRVKQIEVLRMANSRTAASNSEMWDVICDFVKQYK